MGVDGWVWIGGWVWMDGVDGWVGGWVWMDVWMIRGWMECRTLVLEVLDRLRAVEEGVELELVGDRLDRDPWCRDSCPQHR